MGKRTRADKPHYTVTLQWSPEVGGYVCLFPDLVHQYAQPWTDGRTLIRAAKKAKHALEAVMAFAQHEGETLPEPQYWWSRDDE
jgi:predicted RNase H-like HicB family nuclease